MANESSHSLPEGREKEGAFFSWNFHLLVDSLVLIGFPVRFWTADWIGLWEKLADVMASDHPSWAARPTEERQVLLVWEEGSGLW